LAAAKLRYDTLLFKNRQSGIDVRKTVLKIAEARRAEVTHPDSICRQFEALDEARVALIQRAKYLNVAKGEHAGEPKKFAFDYLHIDDKLSSSQRFAQKQDASTDKRKSRPVSRASTSRKKSSSIARGSESKGSQLIKLNDGSLLGQIDAIGVELIQKATTQATDYYASFKVRKVPITRPDKIPALIKDCIDRVRAKWNEIIASAPEINELAAEDLLATVTDASVSTRASLSSMSEHFDMIYFDIVSGERANLGQDFSLTRSQQIEEQNAHRAQLNIRTANANSPNLWIDLSQAEHKRQEAEKSLIAGYRTHVFELETNTAKLFITKLQDFTLLLLDLLDGFIFPEDIQCRPPPPNSTEHPTLRAMLKDQQRKGANPELIPDRVFWTRPWPPLNQTIPAIEAVAQILSAEKPPEDAPPPVPAKTSPKRPVPKKRDQKAAPVVVDRASTPTSLATSLHRAVIIERNKLFESYEKAVGERLENFKDEIEAVQDECYAFHRFWGHCTRVLHLPKVKIETPSPVTPKKRS
jgi:hypothetical protein